MVSYYRESGDLKQLSALYLRYTDLVYGVCFKYLRESESAKDAVMSIFEELVVKLRRHEVEHFKGWLHTLSRNHCLMLLRSAKRKGQPVLEADLMQITEEPHLNGMLEKEEHFERLNHCLQTLSSEQKQTVELFYLQNKSYKEIAAITLLDWNKVRSTIQNGRRNLKLCMEQPIKEQVRIPGNND